MPNDPKAIYDNGEISGNYSRRAASVFSRSREAAGRAGGAVYRSGAGAARYLNTDAPEIVQSHKNAALMAMSGGPIGYTIASEIAKQGKIALGSVKSIAGRSGGRGSGSGGGNDFGQTPDAYSDFGDSEGTSSSSSSSTRKRSPSIRSRAAATTTTSTMAGYSIPETSTTGSVSDPDLRGASKELSKKDLLFISYLSKSITAKMERSERKTLSGTITDSLKGLQEISKDALINIVLPNIGFLKSQKYYTQLPNPKRVGIFVSINTTLAMSYAALRSTQTETHRLLYELIQISKAGFGVPFRVKKPQDVETAAEALGKLARGAAKLPFKAVGAGLKLSGIDPSKINPFGKNINSDAFKEQYIQDRVAARGGAYGGSYNRKKSAGEVVGGGLRAAGKIGLGVGALGALGMISPLASGALGATALGSLGLGALKIPLKIKREYDLEKPGAKKPGGLYDRFLGIKKEETQEEKSNKLPFEFKFTTDLLNRHHKEKMKYFKYLHNLEFIMQLMYSDSKDKKGINSMLFRIHKIEKEQLAVQEDEHKEAKWHRKLEQFQWLMDKVKGAAGAVIGGAKSMLGAVTGTGLGSMLGRGAAALAGGGLMGTIGAILLGIKFPRQAIGGALSNAMGDLVGALLLRLKDMVFNAFGIAARGSGAAASQGASRTGIGSILKGVGKGIGKFSLKRIPGIGAIMSFGVNKAFGMDTDKAAGGAIGSSVGAAVGALGGPIGMVLGSIIGDWIGQKFAPEIMGAISWVTDFFVDKWRDFKDMIVDVGTWAWDKFIDAKDAVFDAFASLGGSILKLGIKATDFFDMIITNINANALTGVGFILEKLVSFFTGLPEMLKNGIRSMPGIEYLKRTPGIGRWITNFLEEDSKEEQMSSEDVSTMLEKYAESIREDYNKRAEGRNARLQSIDDGLDKKSEEREEQKIKDRSARDSARYQARRERDAATDEYRKGRDAKREEQKEERRKNGLFGGGDSSEETEQQANVGSSMAPIVSGSVNTKSVSSFTSAASDKMGSLASFGESGSALGNPAEVSSGKGDKGGVSYGTYQLKSEGGNSSPAAKFVKQSSFADSFAGLTPGTPEFNKMWKQVAEANPQKFAQEQETYIKSQYYDIAAKNILNETGLNVNNRSKALQEVVWARAVQLGPHTSMFKAAFLNAGISDPESVDDATLIKAIYAEQSNLNKYFPSSRSLHKGLANRFVTEEAMALSLLEQSPGAFKSMTNYAKETYSDFAPKATTFLETQWENAKSAAAPALSTAGEYMSSGWETAKEWVSDKVGTPSPPTAGIVSSSDMTPEIDPNQMLDNETAEKERMYSAAQQNQPNSSELANSINNLAATSSNVANQMTVVANTVSSTNKALTTAGQNNQETTLESMLKDPTIFAILVGNI